MSFSVTGKTAIVTGAASGLGLAIGRHLAAKGANVMFADRDEDRLLAELGPEAQGDGPIRAFSGDLCERLAVANLLSATLDAFDRVDILVNAGFRMALSDCLSPDADEVGNLFRENAMTTLRLTQMVSRRMIQAAEKAGREEGLIGSVINLTSVAARQTVPEQLGFSVACAAVEQMTRSMAVALAPKGIRVNAVAIGSVMTTGLQGLLKEQPGLRGQIEAATPLGRIASADEVAETVQYLASEASGFMTGQILTVDGGRVLMGPVRVAT